MVKKVAIITNGGDCPGLNAVIRAIVKTAETHGVECYGYIEGYKGMLENNYIKLESNGSASGLLHRGGTIIGASNSTNLFNYPVEENGQTVYKDMSFKAVENVRNAGFDCIFTLGGDGTQKSARDFSLRGLNVIGIPKTIDNDVAHSEIAGGADAAIIPEIPYDIEKIVEKINRRKAEGKKFSIIVVSEGAKPKGGELTVKRTLHDGAGLDNIRLGGIGEKLSRDLEELTGMVSRNTVLGYVQRGGTPTAFDRVLSTKYGSKAMELAIEGKFNVLVTLQNGRLGYVTLEEVVGNNKEIGARSGGTESTNIKRVTMDDDLVRVARDLDICLGD